MQLLSCKAKRWLYQNESGRSKKEENKTSSSPKKPRYRERRMWEQPLWTRGSRYSFWPVNTGRLAAVSPKQWSAVLHWNGRFHRQKRVQTGSSRLFLSPHTSTWGWQPPLPSDWLRLVWRGKKWEPKKCVESRQCAHRSVRGSDTPVKWEDKMWFHRVYLSLANRRVCERKVGQICSQIQLRMERGLVKVKSNTSYS